MAFLKFTNVEKVQSNFGVLDNICVERTSHVINGSGRKLQNLKIEGGTQRYPPPCLRSIRNPGCYKSFCGLFLAFSAT